MAENFGPGVSRVLSAVARQFTTIVWQDDKPPLDSELTLSSQIEWDRLATMIRAQTHSGFFLDPTRCKEDFRTYPLWSNLFTFGGPSTVSGIPESEPTVYACVNGWVVPVAGTDTTGSPSPEDVTNVIRLNPPPSTDDRIDFVFLEVWRALVSPNPSTVNKPSAAFLWRYGNTQYGGTNLADDIEDPAVPFETTKRVQLQYRLRVVGSGDALGLSVDLVSYPDGLDDPQIRARGAASASTLFPFDNMRSELGDPSLWRAGDGDPANALGTVDGYVYAIPVAAIFRRNAATYTSLSFSGSANQNGATDRCPASHSLPDPRDGARALTAPTLGAVLDINTTGSITVTSVLGSGLDDPELFPVPGDLRFVIVGTGIDEEIIGINSVNGSGGTMTIDVTGRGRGGTARKRHPVGAPIRLYNTRPHSAYADEVTPDDIMDMRRGITFGEWDHNRLLQHAVASIADNGLRTTFKQSGTGGNTQGIVTTEVSYLHSPLASPLTPPVQVASVDGPDGLRTVWSDSAAVQRGTSVILDPSAPISNGIIDAMDTNASQVWSVSADFQPHGFLNTLGSGDGWTHGSVIFFHIGGIDGVSGARYGLQGGTRSVRFIAPYEAWLPGQGPEAGDQHPWKLRFLGGPSGNSETPGGRDSNGYIAGRFSNPAGHEDGLVPPQPMYPLSEFNFEKPFIVLGDILNPAFIFSVVANSTNFVNPSPGGEYQINIPGQNWDTLVQSTFPMGSQGRTLRDYLTADGTDFSGASSQLYIVVYGDTDSRDNNGAFKVIGAGTIAAQTDEPYTNKTADDPSGLVVVPLSEGFVSFFNSTKTVTIEFRSQEITAEADNGKTNPAGVAVVLTDFRIGSWVQIPVALYASGSHIIPINSKAVMDMDVMWYPNRGASPRVPNRLLGFGAINGDATFIQNTVSSIDPNFVTEAPYPEGDRFYDSYQVQLWNLLPSKGLYPYGYFGQAPSTLWGGAVVGQSEQDREAQLFVDLGSKTAIYRPFQIRNMTLKGFTTGSVPSLVGATTYSAGVPTGAPVDGAAIFTIGLVAGYPVPLEYLPRFGRQDIPYHVSTGSTDPVMPGINHLFADQPAINDTASVFYVIGGENNATSGNLVSPMLFATEGSAIGYCLRGTLGGALHPAYGARRQYYSDVVSSDLGVGMRGIELPPYHGIARLYGVYELTDFMSHLSGTYPGAFQGDRITPIVDPPQNLLRTGATKQTLFIRQAGGKDVTGSDYAHTYLVPESAIDISNIPGYVDGQTFTDFNYVVECVVFGFSDGFISHDNFVLARRKSGGGVAVANDSNLELPQTAMVLPAAAPKGNALYEVYERTVYQGDPYMTRDGTTVQPADYQNRYGQLPAADAFELATPIQQFSPTTGLMSVVRPNPRALEVLATMDFYTTLGTGKIGGRMWAGTPLDCGYTDPTAGALGRIPTTPLDAQWAVLPRAFTEGQNTNSSYATLEILIKNYADAITFHLTVILDVPGVGSIPLIAPDFTGVSNAAMAVSLADKMNAAMGQYIVATAESAVVLVQALVPGAAGNLLKLRTELRPNASPAAPGAYSGAITDIAQILLEGELAIRFPPSRRTVGAATGANFRGGADVPVNAGNGDSAVSLVGMTERLPLGILVSDSDFLSENILGDRATSLRSFTGGVRAVYEDLPLAQSGQEYTRFVNDPGSLLSLSDGAILRYTPFNVATPSGTKSFRLYRGGGATMVLSGSSPGGPVSWVSESFAPALNPVLKGAALACKAILVRNYHEDAFALSETRSEGDELQVVILTYAVYGTPTSTEGGVTLSGVISPTGYGEGYAAADRYRIQGRPMDRGRSRTTPNPGLQPAPFFTEEP